MITQKKQDGEEREADENTEEAGWGRKHVGWIELEGAC